MLRSEDNQRALQDVPQPLRFARKAIQYQPWSEISNEIPNQVYRSLGPIVRFIRQNPESEIIIEGYTDSNGNYAYNKKLSKFRADIIRNYFAGQGIPLSRIKAYGLGPDNPIAGNDTLEGRKQNRRVEIKINMKE